MQIWKERKAMLVGSVLVVGDVARAVLRVCLSIVHLRDICSVRENSYQLKAVFVTKKGRFIALDFNVQRFIVCTTHSNKRVLICTRAMYQSHNAQLPKSILRAIVGSLPWPSSWPLPLALAVCRPFVMTLSMKPFCTSVMPLTTPLNDT
jgi:hypothetical protein